MAARTVAAKEEELLRDSSREKGWLEAAPARAWRALEMRDSVANGMRKLFFAMTFYHVPTTIRGGCCGGSRPRAGGDLLLFLARWPEQRECSNLVPRSNIIPEIRYSGESGRCRDRRPSRRQRF